MAAIPRTTDAYGRVTISAENAFEYLFQGGELGELLVEDSEETRIYNDWCRVYDKPAHLVATPDLRTDDPADEHARRAADWMIPDDYRSLDVEVLLLDRCTTQEQRLRIRAEMAEFEARDLLPVLRTMVYLVDTFRRGGIVWGVGRGSSVASYALYLIGVHKLDPMAYGLEIGEFLK